LPKENDWQRNDYRHELKIPLQRRQFAEFDYWLKSAGLRASETYPSRQIHSVYLDSSDLDDYQDNVSGMSQRGKLRFRWYDDAADKIVLEFKNKRGKLSNKLIVNLENPEAAIPFERRLAETLLRNNKRSLAVVNQLNVFPTLHVQYDREYFELAPEVRMTVDRNIRYQKLYPLTSHSSSASSVEVVVEIKYPPSKSQLISRLLEGVPGRIFRHSKYVIGVDTVCNL